MSYEYTTLSAMSALGAALASSSDEGTEAIDVPASSSDNGQTPYPDNWQQMSSEERMEWVRVNRPEEYVELPENWEQMSQREQLMWVQQQHPGSQELPSWLLPTLIVVVTGVALLAVVMPFAKGALGAYAVAPEGEKWDAALRGGVAGGVAKWAVDPISRLVPGEHTQRAIRGMAPIAAGMYVGVDDDDDEKKEA